MIKKHKKTQWRAVKKKRSAMNQKEAEQNVPWYITAALAGGKRR